ncbi:hypothetical protein GQ44DRAFT_722688 [Phaeosphaeriaceae sp. PMI808]|nr:hypothetical protein GQ44DRAFT_722688 [Phaeosphaeriaceae sp. PMI808]
MTGATEQTVLHSSPHRFKPVEKQTLAFSPPPPEFAIRASRSSPWWDHAEEPPTAIFPHGCVRSASAPVSTKEYLACDSTQLPYDDSTQLGMIALPPTHKRYTVAITAAHGWLWSLPSETVAADHSTSSRLAWHAPLFPS